MNVCQWNLLKMSEPIPSLAPLATHMHAALAQPYKLTSPRALEALIQHVQIQLVVVHRQLLL